MTPTITLEELYGKIERGDPFVLFEVLAPMYWRRHHLPGAINMPPNAVLDTARAHAPDRDTEIIVYCWDDD